MDVYGKTYSQQRSLKNKGSLKKFKSLPREASASTKGNTWSNGFQSEVLQINDEPLENPSLEGEAVGIITLEDVIEELLQVGGNFLPFLIFFPVPAEDLPVIWINLCRRKSMMKQITMMTVNTQSTRHFMNKRDDYSAK